ncbi:hypothetical protein PVAND_008203 [Polypedilum vanderplanki]|uniref:U6 small nuclear RNA (adenine-(43)-N(6))-methyltransferase n=1 Tax=Polypedilum vanderplanki TaxID=319348 RepID=A0A9J6C9H2_POLVA|nr:hypothetical protein PVAND_008203 [Polypedilum vanderplanki]
MHPRNIYKNPPDFNKLRIEYPEFAAKVHIDVDGKIKLNFNDQESVRVLTQCCLMKDFDLKVELPIDKLIPTLPLRLNYILWIEDLLNHCSIKENVFGIDIGTGASCIYSLLLIKMHTQWKMFALEIDKENLKYANKNINYNQFDEKIVLINQEGSNKIFENLFKHDSNHKTFCVCNPPFFSSKNELVLGSENRTGKRKRPRSSYKESSTETVFTEGGELEFVKKIFNESLELKEKVEIYSSMFGCKKNLLNFITVLKHHDIKNFTTTEFVQGKTFRWAIAWSFNRNLLNFEDHTSKKKFEKKPNVLTHTIDDEFETTHSKILNLLSNLKINLKLINKNEKDKYFKYELEALENTWTNQRRKRRAGNKLDESSTFHESASASQEENIVMGFEIYKSNLKSSVNLKIFYLRGTMSRDCVNQILQYIKNNLK